jgi:hypothetical protein
MDDVLALHPDTNAWPVSEQPTSRQHSHGKIAECGTAGSTTKRTNLRPLPRSTKPKRWQRENKVS